MSQDNLRFQHLVEECLHRVNAAQRPFIFGGITDTSKQKMAALITDYMRKAFALGMDISSSATIDLIQYAIQQQLPRCPICKSPMIQQKTGWLCEKFPDHHAFIQAPTPPKGMRSAENLKLPWFVKTDNREGMEHNIEICSADGKSVCFMGMDGTRQNKLGHKFAQTIIDAVNASNAIAETDAGKLATDAISYVAREGHDPNGKRYRMANGEPFDGTTHDFVKSLIATAILAQRDKYDAQIEKMRAALMEIKALDTSAKATEDGIVVTLGPLALLARDALASIGKV